MAKHLLIVEDQGALADALARRFARRGFDVSECTDPQQALECLRQKQVDLVICDIQLNNNISGLDIFLKMKQEGKTLPFIFFTGHSEGTEEILRAQEHGADAVFSKPTDFGVLLQKVCVLLGLSAETLSLAGPK